MKTFTLLKALVAFLIMGGSLSAQEAKHPAKPMLWKVEGQALTKPSYLFGTLHLGLEAVTTLHPEARKAFESAEVVHTELPMDPASQLAIAPLTIRKDGKTLNESIGEELAARLDEELKVINPLLDSSPFQTLSTWVITVTVTLLPDQLAGNKSLDTVLWEEAVESGKKTGALETAEGQLTIFTEMTEKEQVEMLAETLRVLKDDRKNNRDSLAVLTQAYLSGDPDKLEAEMQRGIQEAGSPEMKKQAEKFMKRLITDRDVTMAATIAEVLEKDPATIHFFAAGAGHFSSKTSIRHHLEEAGYTVTRIGG